MLHMDDPGIVRRAAFVDQTEDFIKLVESKLADNVRMIMLHNDITHLTERDVRSAALLLDMDPDLMNQSIRYANNVVKRTLQ